MCGSATLTMVVSRTSMNAASGTTMAISHGFAAGFHADASPPDEAPPFAASAPLIATPFAAACRAPSPPSFQIHLRRNRKPESKRPVVWQTCVDDDLDRHTLHDFHEVAGRVFGWKRGEARAAAELHAVHVAAQIELRVGVDTDFDLVAGTHAFELRLLEVRGDPDLRRDDRKQP